MIEKSSRVVVDHAKSCRPRSFFASKNMHKLQKRTLFRVNVLIFTNFGLVLNQWSPIFVWSVKQKNLRHSIGCQFFLVVFQLFFGEFF